MTINVLFISRVYEKLLYCGKNQEAGNLTWSTLPQLQNRSTIEYSTDWNNFECAVILDGKIKI